MATVLHIVARCSAARMVAASSSRWSAYKRGKRGKNEDGGGGKGGGKGMEEVGEGNSRNQKKKSPNVSEMPINRT